MLHLELIWGTPINFAFLRVPKNLPRKKEMIAKGRADEILEKTSLKGPEDMKPGQVVLKEEDESKLDSGGEEAIPRPRKGLQRMSQMEAR